MNKASYRYSVNFKYRNQGSKIHTLITGYVPSGLKMADIKKYIQGNAADKKIVGLYKITQRQYYPELSAVGEGGQIDVLDQELYDAQQAERDANDKAVSEQGEENGS